MNRYYSVEDNDNRRRGFWISVIIHILLLFLFLLPFFKSKQINKPDQLQGVVVALGNPDAEFRKVAEARPPAKKATPKKTSPQVKKTSAKPKPQTHAVKSKTVEDNSAVLAAKEAARKKAEAEHQRQKAAEEARLKAEEEARMKAEEEARKKKEAKSRFSKFSSKNGSGEADASKGQENGKPNADKLKGLTKGTGRTGDGLGSRELLHAPSIQDNTQKTGRVIINICVNAQGKVIQSRFRQKGSTTTDAHLIKLAESSAKKYVFSKSQADEQCGDIIIDFKLK